MVIKREENINKSNKWIEYIKSKSILKKKLAKSNVDITIGDIEKCYENGKYADSKVIIVQDKIQKNKYKIISIEDPHIDTLNTNIIKSFTGGDIIKARPKLILTNNELPKYEDNVNTWRRMKIVPFEKK
jgi:hypothetical protein